MPLYKMPMPALPLALLLTRNDLWRHPHGNAANFPLRCEKKKAKALRKDTVAYLNTWTSLYKMSVPTLPLALLLTPSGWWRHPLRARPILRCGVKESIALRKRNCRYTTRMPIQTVWNELVPTNPARPPAYLQPH